MKWLSYAAPDVANWLHEGNKRRLFTCSSLQFPIPTQRMREAERDNIHLPLDPEKTYTVRVTLLLGELFPLFHKALTDFNTQNHGASKPPFMQIGKQSFLLEEVIADLDDPTGWTGYTSLTNLVEKAKSLKLGKVEPLTLEFASLTTFLCPITSSLAWPDAGKNWPRKNLLVWCKESALNNIARMMASS